MADADAAEAEGYGLLAQKILHERGFGCAAYKDGCMRRRIAARMRACGVSSYGEYAAYLDRMPTEWDRLMGALTVNVTSFFRNRAVYDALAQVVVPALWALPSPLLRIWSAGCASGEEAYSLAILFHQEAARRGELDRLGRVRVLATDVDTDSLVRGAAGSYAEGSFRETPARVRAAYFTATPPFRVIPEVRHLVRFSRHDLLRDPAPPGPFHLVVCRNVLIYFERPAQQRLLADVHARLARDGFLALGKTETVLGSFRDAFEPVLARERIYRRRA